MSNQSHSISRFLLARKFWKPAVATGVGGTTLIIWFEEVIAFATDFIGVIFVAILGGLICLFDNILFKSRIPRQNDLQDASKGVKK